MGLDGLKHGVLVLVGQGAQRVSQGGADGSPCKGVLSCGRQMGGDIYPAGDPLRFVSELTSDTFEAHTLLAHQGTDHSSLIECGDGAGRAVGKKEQAFVLG